ncbi:MAG: MBL fold metallo-hydrolase RNA specificity domain-containing protein, partial [Bacteroidia bacterium]
ETDELNRNLGLDPQSIDAVILSHAHIDHSGNLPLLVKQGFTGPIYCTPATLDVCKLLLVDSAHIHESDVIFINKRRRKKGLPDIKPLYTVSDAERSLKFFRPVKFNEVCHVNEEVSFSFSPNGHIIGSAAVHISVHESGKTTTLAFTGDIGRYADPILPPPEAFGQADYIISESTYGNRLHEAGSDAETKFLSIVLETCVKNRGRLVIPAFSLGRTQEVLYMINKLENKGVLPAIKIYVDSPLSTHATEVVKKHRECFNEELKAYLKNDPDPFGFPHLKYIEDATASKALNQLKEPCIIISASGMADAGRVKHHIANAVGDPRNAILIMGYCAPRTLGAKLLAHEKQVHIFGEYYSVKAKVEAILSYSAHADYNEILKFLSCQAKQKVKRIFLVHGESAAKVSLKDKLLAEGYADVSIPLKGESFHL